MNLTNLVWKPNKGPQERALSIDIREILYGGARGGGKTDAGIVFMMMPAVGENSFSKYRGLVLRKNYTDLCDWIERATVFYSAYGARKSNGDFTFPNGAIIRTGHLKDADAYEKYQGHEYQRLLIEELTQIPDEERYLKIVASCRSTVPGLKARIFLTTNPGGPGHSWVKKRFIDVGEAGVPQYAPISTSNKEGANSSIRSWRIFIPSKVEDNPALLNDKDYMAFLEGLPEKVRKAWRDGDWNVLSGQYFSEFDPDIHICKPFKIPDYWTIEAGLDWGYSPDPWACVWIAIDEHGDIVVFREATNNNQIPAECEEEIIYLSNGRRPRHVLADPSMWARKDGDSSAEKFRKLNLIKANNERIQGWMRIHEYLRLGSEGKPHLRIFSNCTETIRCLTTLIHGTKDPEDCQDDPSIDHLPDALRYVLMGRPELGRRPPKPKPVDSRARRAYEHRMKLARLDKKRNSDY